MQELIEHDRSVAEGGLVAGADEVGRGPLAGPLVAVAVLIDPEVLGQEGERLKFLGDSKRLTARRRERLSRELMQIVERITIVSCSPQTIDRDGIGPVNRAALERSLRLLGAPAGTPLIADGNLRLGEGIRSVVKGDAKSAAIAAASILAKEARDRLMRRAAEVYPGYGFETNAGYSTPRHKSALRQRGPCSWHRRSFSW